jgi:hypothetical protein
VVKIAAATNKLQHHNSEAEHICLLCQLPTYHVLWCQIAPFAPVPQSKHYPIFLKIQLNLNKTLLNLVVKLHIWFWNSEFHIQCQQKIVYLESINENEELLKVVVTLFLQHGCWHGFDYLGRNEQAQSLQFSDYNPHLAKCCLLWYHGGLSGFDTLHANMPILLLLYCMLLIYITIPTFVHQSSKLQKTSTLLFSELRKFISSTFVGLVDENLPKVENWGKK